MCKIETDRQTDRQTNRQRQREKARERERERERGGGGLNKPIYLRSTSHALSLTFSQLFSFLSVVAKRH